MLSRFISPACTGITSERKITNSSSIESTTTTPMNSGSLLDSTAAKSTEPAVKPPTSAVTPSWRFSGGSTSWRKWLTRSVVACDCGAERGYAWITAIFPEGPSRGAVTATTSGVRATAARNVDERGGLKLLIGLHRDQQRAVEPLSEPAREQVEREVGARVRRIVAGVAGVKSHAEHRHQE